MGKLTKDKDGITMNEYKLILINHERESCIGSVIGDSHKIFNNCLLIKDIKDARTLATLIFVTKIIEYKSEEKQFEKIIRVYTYLPEQNSNLVINKMCNWCEKVTKHNIYLQDKNTVSYYECSECGNTINSDIIVEVE